MLARAGFGSRRACEELIQQRRVRVNDEVAALGSKVVPEDRIEVDGLAVSLGGASVYYLLHKPAGTVTTASDPQGRPTVLDLVPDEPRVFPVGRLDLDTSGLLLLTNDGEFALRMTHPRYGVPKTYVAEVAAEPSRGQMAALRRGVPLEDGPATATRARIVAAGPGKGVVEVQVHEGRNRIVRRLLDAVGLPVTSLARVALGPITLGRLRAGHWRALRTDEVLALVAAARRD